MTWEQVYEGIKDPERFPFDSEQTHCGPFSFEIRVWDLGADDTKELADKFDIQKSRIRKDISAHKGISVYRDGILVLPKSDSSRDWLGLDLRRVSKVGTRLSTSQIVGYVSISADDNPNIGDTSDRERLASNLEVAEFEELLKAIVALLENERDEDREKIEKEKPLDDLFEKLTADEMIEEISAMADDGASASDVMPILNSYVTSLKTLKQEIQVRFVHYSRMATVGTIAHMLVHEIRNRTLAIGNFLETVRERFGPFNEEKIARDYKYADSSVSALERLADTFSPLASRSFRRRKRHAILEERIRECLELQRGEIKRKNIKCIVPDSETHVLVDPGELDAVLLNLITNACFWLSETPKESRMLSFSIEQKEDGKIVAVQVDDSGPGIQIEPVEKVFWPGVTKKPMGIGMGLTVASEIVGEYGGTISTIYPGAKGGASFVFDLPLK